MLGILLYVVGLTIVFGLLTTIATDGQARSVPYTEFKQLNQLIVDDDLLVPSRNCLYWPARLGHVRRTQ